MKNKSFRNIICTSILVLNFCKAFCSPIYTANKFDHASLEDSSRSYFKHCDSLLSIIDGTNMQNFAYLSITTPICFDSICFSNFALYQSNSISKYTFVEFRSNNKDVDTLDIQIYLFENNIFCINFDIRSTYHDFYDRYILRDSKLLGFSWGPSCRMFPDSRMDDFITLKLPRYTKLIDILFTK